jgi:hypothetical protein
MEGTVKFASPHIVEIQDAQATTHTILVVDELEMVVRSDFLCDLWMVRFWRGGMHVGTFYPSRNQAYPRVEWW